MGQGAEDSRRQGPRDQEVFLQEPGQYQSPSPVSSPEWVLWLNGGARGRNQKKCRDRGTASLLPSFPVTLSFLTITPPFWAKTHKRTHFLAWPLDRWLLCLGSFILLLGSGGCELWGLLSPPPYQAHHPSVNQSRKKGRD